MTQRALAVQAGVTCQTKEHGLSLGVQFAQAGLFVICFDPWLHGERSEPLRERAANPAYGGVYPPESGLDIAVVFFRVIHQCLLDAQALLEHYRGDPRVDVSRCGTTAPTCWRTPWRPSTSSARGA